MSRYSRRYLDAIPAELEHPVAAVARAVGETPKLYEPMPTQRSWVGHTSSHFVYLATDAWGRARIALEAGRAAWARSHGAPVPRVVAGDEDGSWLVLERVADDPPEGAGYVGAALRAAEAFSRLPQLPPELARGGSSRRASRRTLAVRLLRMVRAGVPLREFAILRRRAAALPATAMGHRDFTVGNVLHDAAAGTVHVLDLEFMGRAPRGLDALQLWCGLDERADRDRLLEEVLAGADRHGRAALATLHRWLSLRAFADRSIAPPRIRQPHRIREAAALADEARRNVRRWGIELHA